MQLICNGEKIIPLKIIMGEKALNAKQRTRISHWFNREQLMNTLVGGFNLHLVLIQSDEAENLYRRFMFINNRVKKEKFYNGSLNALLQIEFYRQLLIQILCEKYHILAS